jgi:isopentenyldiphosphate isomerase
MRPFSSEDLRALHHEVRQLKRGDGLTQAQFDGLSSKWLPIAQPDEKQRKEHFALCRPDGATTGVQGPRWMFHLFGLRHRAAEIAFATPSGLIVLQRRSPTKEEYPDALDMAVAGHISQYPDGSDRTFLQGAWKEIAEEIGLTQSESRSLLAEGELIPIGEPYFCLEADWRRNPPFFDAEIRQIYAATLTGEGLAHLHFSDNEVSSLSLVTPDTAWEILRAEQTASGLRYSLPRYLDWLEKQTPANNQKL